MKNIILASLAYAAISTGIPTHAEQIQTDTQEKITTFLIKPQYPYDKQGNIDFGIFLANKSLSECTGGNNTNECRDNATYQKSKSFPEIDMEKVCTGNKLCALDLAIFLDSDELIQHPKFKEASDEGDINMIIEAFIAGWNYPTSEDGKNDRSHDIFHYLNRLPHVSEVYANGVAEKYNCNTKHPCIDQKGAISLIAKRIFTQGAELRIAKYQLPMPKYTTPTIDRKLFEK